MFDYSVTFEPNELVECFYILFFIKSDPLKGYSTFILLEFLPEALPEPTDNLPLSYNAASTVFKSSWSMKLVCSDTFLNLSSPSFSLIKDSSAIKSNLYCSSYLRVYSSISTNSYEYPLPVKYLSIEATLSSLFSLFIWVISGRFNYYSPPKNANSRIINPNE